MKAQLFSAKASHLAMVNTFLGQGQLPTSSQTLQASTPVASSLEASAILRPFSGPDAGIATHRLCQGFGMDQPQEPQVQLIFAVLVLSWQVKAPFGGYLRGLL